MQWFRKLVKILGLLTSSPAEREYREVCQDRADLDDREFHQSFYRESPVTLDTCSRVRRVLNSQLNLSNVRPEDNLAVIFDDIDFGEICLEIGTELGIQLTDDKIQSMDGTVDSIIRMVDRLSTGGVK